MLILSRKKNERVCLGNDVVITVVDIRGDKVRMGFDAPREVAVHRGEVFDAIKRAKESEGDEPDYPNRELARKLREIATIIELSEFPISVELHSHNIPPVQMADFERMFSDCVFETRSGEFATWRHGVVIPSQLKILAFLNRVEVTA